MPDPRVAVHRLRSLVEMLARDERIPAEVRRMRRGPRDDHGLRGGACRRYRSGTAVLDTLTPQQRLDAALKAAAELVAQECWEREMNRYLIVAALAVSGCSPASMPASIPTVAGPAYLPQTHASCPYAVITVKDATRAPRYGIWGNDEGVLVDYANLASKPPTASVLAWPDPGPAEAAVQTLNAQCAKRD